MGSGRIEWRGSSGYLGTSVALPPLKKRDGKCTDQGRISPSDIPPSIWDYKRQDLQLMLLIPRVEVWRIFCRSQKKHRFTGTPQQPSEVTRATRAVLRRVCVDIFAYRYMNAAATPAPSSQCQGLLYVKPINQKHWIEYMPSWIAFLGSLSLPWDRQTKNRNHVMGLQFAV
jgi:hypothetical protein